MSYSQIFKRVLIPCAAGVGLDGHNFGPNCVKRSESATRPSDLPIYSKECAVCGQVSTRVSCPNGIEEAVGNIRRELWVWQDNLKGYRHKIVDVYRSTVNRATYVVDYLREESHGPQRYGAIGLSGLTGFVYGLRRGTLGRLFYATCGTLAMGAVCYPNEAAYYTDKTLAEGKRRFIIAYHFVCGETPKWPEPPEWLNSIKEQVGKFQKFKDEKTTDEHKRVASNLASITTRKYSSSAVKN